MTGTPRLPNADAAREVLHALEDLGVCTVRERLFPGFRNALRNHAHAGFGTDDVLSGKNRKAQRFKFPNDRGRRTEFAPAFFGVGVKISPTGDHAFKRRGFFLCVRNLHL